MSNTIFPPLNKLGNRFSRLPINSLWDLSGEWLVTKMVTLILFHCIQLPDSSQMPFVAWHVIVTQCHFLLFLLGKLYDCRFMQIDKPNLIRGKPTRSIVVKV